MPRTEETDRHCRECWDRAIYAYGTATIFLNRSRLYRKLLRALSFFGIVVPLIIGGVVLAYGINSTYLTTLIPVAAALGLIQLVFSAWSIAFGWTEKLEYSLDSTADNFGLSVKFKELGEQADAPPADLTVRFTELRAKDDARRAMDATKEVTDKELRYGHRAGLRQFGRECDACHSVPRSMKPTNCDVCGRF